MTGAPLRRPFSFSSMPPGSHPVLELPGPELDLPRRQIDQPPLLHAIRRPVREAPLFLGLGFGDTFDLTPPILLRPGRNEIDEFRLVGHGTLLATPGASAECAPRYLTTRCRSASTLRHAALYRHSLTSTKCPAIAAAAAIAGETRWGRPSKAFRPSKLRFEVEAQRSSGFSLSGFMARHIEQPGSRPSKPALMKILW